MKIIVVETNVSTFLKETEVYQLAGRISPVLKYLYYCLILLWLSFPMDILSGLS